SVRQNALTQLQEGSMKNGLLNQTYRLILIASHIVVMAVFILIMNLSAAFQMILLGLCALIFIWVFTPRESSEPPCGEEVGPEGIARHMETWQEQQTIIVKTHAGDRLS